MQLNCLLSLFKEDKKINHISNLWHLSDDPTPSFLNRLIKCPAEGNLQILQRKVHKLDYILPSLDQTACSYMKIWTVHFVMKFLDWHNSWQISLIYCNAFCACVCARFKKWQDICKYIYLYKFACCACAWFKKWEDIQSEFWPTGAWSIMWILPKLSHTDDAHHICKAFLAQMTGIFK